MTSRPNPLKLNALQLKTLVILQELARDGDVASPAEDGAVAIRELPRPHGDHFHVGSAVVLSRDATGLFNPSVYGALARKGLVLGAPAGMPVVTREGLAYETGIAGTILHRADH
ncbi:hypothetical protein SH611_11055 [Geminicoccaceae bacterium 1502E]|nr:hypothetical protein [Geminicoccaceae bacterium 1502E]